MKKVGKFFVAMIPYWLFLGVQLGVSLVGGIVGGVIAGINAAATGAEIDPANILSPQLTLMISVAAQIAAFIAGLIIMKASKIKMSEMSPVKQSGKVYGISVVFTVGAFFVLQLINMLMLNLFGVTEADSTQELLASSTVLMFVTALFAPFVEELIFRGLLVTTFKRQGFSNWFTIVAVTLSFGLIHSQNMIVYALVFGLVLMGIRFITGDWKICVVFHFVGNLMSCLFNVIVPEEAGGTVMTVGAAVGLVVAIIFAVLGTKASKQAKEEQISDVSEASVTSPELA